MMMAKKKVVFIDGEINIAYIESRLREKQHIAGSWTVSDNKVIRSVVSSSNVLQHATLCTKIFLDNVACDVELFFVNIWTGNKLKANVGNLFLALLWCLDKDIDIINLSIGSTDISDVSQLGEVTSKLISSGTIIVAASANDNKLTFPAAFDGVLSVKGFKSAKQKQSWRYCENDIDRINVKCYIKNETIEYESAYYDLDCSSSLATPIISARICNLFDEGYDSLEKIKIRLEEDSKGIDILNCKSIYKKYFEEDIRIPIITVITGGNKKKKVDSLIERMLLKFAEYSYNGICLSECRTTDLRKKIISIRDSYSYHLTEKLKFYSYYCDVDLIVIEIENELVFDEIKDIETDILIYYQDIRREMKSATCDCTILFSGEEFESLFNKIYSYLSME